jgi:GMP synthase PP-ATPase subunit
LTEAPLLSDRGLNTSATMVINEQWQSFTAFLTVTATGFQGRKRMKGKSVFEALMLHSETFPSFQIMRLLEIPLLVKVNNTYAIF